MNTARRATTARKTAETRIEVELALDGRGSSEISTGFAFFDHMLAQLAKHSRWDLRLSCVGDGEVDDHHTIEDCALALGACIDMAVGEQIYLHKKVFFELEKAELLVESYKVLDALVEVLVDHPEIRKIRVEGHTDTQGTDAYNQELSEARAAAVGAYLVKAGIKQDRIETVGLGESRTLQSGDSEDVHATNRRVEVHILEITEKP